MKIMMTTKEKKICVSDNNISGHVSELLVGFTENYKEELEKKYEKGKH